MTITETILHPSKTETATGTKLISISAKSLKSILNVTAASGTTPTLNVKIQQVDPISLAVLGADIINHTQATGTTTEEKDFLDSATRLLGTVLLVTWTIGGTTPSFTFSITLITKD